jgi:hypothetical protein
MISPTDTTSSRRGGRQALAQLEDVLHLVAGNEFSTLHPSRVGNRFGRPRGRGRVLIQRIFVLLSRASPGRGSDEERVVDMFLPYAPSSPQRVIVYAKFLV